MHKSIVLACLLALLGGCVTQPETTIRRGRLIKLQEPAPALVCASTSAPVPAARVMTPAPAPVPPAASATQPASEANPSDTSPLVARRDGALVHVSWHLPASDLDYKAIEIMRNTEPTATGRGRVRAVRAHVTSLEDTVPDAGADYWYWLKLTRSDGQVRNIGPVEANASR